jgi:3-isopropylmalate/(R)-2-methylmalate dehydratase large subunit
MGQTIAEKIFSAHCRKTARAGEILFAPVDLMMTNDASFTTVLDPLRKIKDYTVRDPRKLVMILDHYCPSPSQEVSRIHQGLKEFAR